MPPKKRLKNPKRRKKWENAESKVQQFYYPI